MSSVPDIYRSVIYAHLASRDEIDRRFRRWGDYQRGDERDYRAGSRRACSRARHWKVAEGIETAEQRAFLISNGCPIGQGYHFGKPMPSTAATWVLTFVS